MEIIEITVTRLIKLFDRFFYQITHIFTILIISVITVIIHNLVMLLYRDGNVSNHHLNFLSFWTLAVHSS